MRIARVTAVLVEGGRLMTNFKYVFLCGLEKDRVASRHEWMGYSLVGKVKYPFTLEENGALDYGWPESIGGSTTLRESEIKVGATFTTTHKIESVDQVDLYEITNCIFYEVDGVAGGLGLAAEELATS